MKITVILPAAGVGKRFASSGSDKVDPLLGSSAAKSKIEADLAGTPVFMRAIRLFSNRPDVGQVILAVNPDNIDSFKFKYGDQLSFQNVTVVPGGLKERWETVSLAIDAVNDDCTHVAVHDAARPLTSTALIDRIFGAAAKHDAVIPGHTVSATLKRYKPADVGGDDEADRADLILGEDPDKPTVLGAVSESIDRAKVVAVQTPQVFEKQLLIRAYEQIKSGKLSGEGITDDAGLVESLGEAVYVVEGDAMNLKITQQEDMKLAKLIAQSQDKTKGADLGAKRLFGDLDED